MKTTPNLTDHALSPEWGALQFEQLIEIYIELGLPRAQAAAAAQADYLSSHAIYWK